MYKGIFILFNVVFTLMLNVIFGDGVKVTQNAPSEVKPGDEFTVELIINKTDVSGFAKIQQELPEGFTAEAIENEGASFTFNEQKVKLIWMALPETEEFTVKYKVIVGENISGEFEITGKFSYLHNNERKTIDLNGNFISVKSEEEPMAENQPEPTSVQPEPTATVDLTVETERNVNQNEDGSYNVEIKISHNGIKGFAKIQEQLPMGSESAEGIETANAVFSNVDGLAKFVWMGLPETNEIIVSYKINGIVNAQTFNDMEGTFAYLDNEESKKKEIQTSVLNITEPITETTTETTGSEQDSTEAIAQQQAEEERKAQEEAELAAKQAAEQEAKRKAEQEAIAQQQAEEERKAQEEAALAKKQKELNDALAAEQNNEPSMTNTPAPQTGIAYKVQICAGHNAVEVPTYFKKEFSFTEEAIATENHEGWIKYTIGAFDTYKNARDRRNVVTNGYTFPGPFVTAYNSGDRITVQEALMISNQKWVQ